MTPEVCDELGAEGDLCLQLQAGLIFTPLPHGTHGWSYRIEDPSRTQFYRVGAEEYALISLVDGKSTLRQIWQELQASAMAPHLRPQDAVTIARWLPASGLAVPVQDGLVLSTQAERNRLTEGRSPGWNPLLFRVPLIRPDRLIQAMLPWTGWIHSPAMLLAWSLTLLVAVYRVASQWSRFSTASIGVLGRGNWLWLLGTVLILKALHEFSHATACRRYGGRVGAAGVMLVFFAPLAWIDVTSSWQFPSRWRRIHVAVAGMYLETWIAAGAALWWCHVEPGILSFHLYNVVLVGGVSSLLFNANPLMRADGYYVLSDLADIPNLMATAMQQMQGMIRRVLVGNPSPCPAYTGWRQLLILTYGPAACCWRLFVYTCLILGASVLLNGAGVVVAVLCIAALLLRPLRRFAAEVIGRFRRNEVSIRRLLLAGAVCLCCFLVPMFGVGWRQQCSAPGVIQFAPHSVVRSRAAGFLKDVRVSVNQRVGEGDILAVLESDELQTQLSRLKFSVDASSLRCRLLQRQNRIAEYRIENENLTGLQEQLREKEAQVDSLVIRAPHTGTVTGRDLQALVGAYFNEGDELLCISGNGGREMRISLPQEDAESFAALVGKRVNVRMVGRNLQTGRVVQLTPRGTMQLDMPQLSAAVGGPVAVRAVNSDRVAEEQQPLELFAPRFSATVQITGRADALRAGETGAVSWLGNRRSAGERIVSGIQRWIAARVDLESNARR